MILTMASIYNSVLCVVLFNHLIVYSVGTNVSNSDSSFTTKQPGISSTSSSASSEDQLAASNSVLEGAAILSGSSTTCVTCPQTVCTLSKVNKQKDDIILKTANLPVFIFQVSYNRQAIHHHWRVDGLPDYISYLEKFQVGFEMHSEVRFNTTPPNDGIWTFTLVRVPTPNSNVAPWQTFNSNLHEPRSSSPVELRVQYHYQTEATAQQQSPFPKVSFDLWLSLQVEDEYITLPSQISSQPTLTTADGGKYTWTYLFLWSDIQSKLQQLTEQHGLESQVVDFKFVINSYQEEAPKSEQVDQCQNWGNANQNPTQGHRKSYLEIINGNGYSYNASRPPFLSKIQAIMKDDTYTDLTIKSGDDEFQIHRVIAAYSSPVLGQMIYNVTVERGESLLDLGEDVGSDVVEELIRYMYIGRAEDIDEIADRLLVAATEYGFPALKRFCEQALVKQVKIENAFNMYALAVQVQSQRLKRRAFAVMKE